MKKFLLFIALAAGVVFGCSKKNDTTPTTSSITGKWYAVKDTATTYVDGVSQGTNTNTYNHTDYVQFNSDGSGVTLTGTSATSFTYKLSGSTITVSEPAQTIDGHAIPAFTQNGTIKSITSTSLVIAASYSVTVSGSVLKATSVNYYTK